MGNVASRVSSSLEYRLRGYPFPGWREEDKQRLITAIAQAVEEGIDEYRKSIQRRGQPTIYKE